MELIVRRRRYRPGARVCDGCNELHLEANFSEIVKPGKTRGVLRCAMCTVVATHKRGVTRKIIPAAPADAEGDIKSHSATYTQETLIP